MPFSLLWRGVKEKKQNIGEKINMEYYAFILCLMLVAVVKRCEAQVRPSGSGKYREEAIQIINSIFHKYNGRVAPLPYPEPVTLDIHMSLVAVQDLDVDEQYLDTVVDLEIEWNDGRLQWYPLVVTKITVESESVWKPELSVINALDSPTAVNDPDLVVKSTGTIYWFRRLKLRTYCKTNSSNTEDPIECAISLGSRLYDTNEQDFNKNEETNSFDVSSAFSDQKWEVAQHGIGKSTRVVEMPVLKKSEPSNVTESFNYTELHFWMVLERTEYFNHQRDKALELKSLSSGAVYYSTSVFILLSLVLLFYLR